MFNKKVSISVVAALILSSQLVANDSNVDADNNSSDLGEMQVYGSLISNQMEAIKIQKESNSIVNVVSSDGIGKLPDRNAAEAAARIPGVSIERDQGEGRFISVRGLPSQWSSTTLNGSRLPTAEQQNTSRATAFDFFPTEMIERIEVYKALRPDLEGDAIGGSVNFVTATAPEEQIISVTAAANYNEKAKESGHNLNLLYGDRFFDDKFGMLVNFTSWDRSWATDNFEARRKGGEEGIYRLELRDYFGERKTLGLNTAAEYLFNDDNKITFRGIYGSLEDYEVNYKHRYRFDKSTEQADGTFTGGRIEKQNIYNTMEHKSMNLELGGEHKLDDKNKFKWSLASLENSFGYNDDPKSYNSWMFTKKDVTFEGLTTTDSGSRSMVTGTTPSTHLPSSYTSTPDEFGMSTVWLWEGEVVEKDNIVAALDFDHELTPDIDLKFGAKFRDKERTQKESHRYYIPADGADIPTMADFNSYTQPNSGDFDEALGSDYSSTFTNVVSEDELKEYWAENKDSDWVLDETGNPTATVENGKALSKNFKVKEQHTAVYGMGTWDVDNQWNVLGGVRLENTKTKVIGKIMDNDTGIISDNVDTKEYLAVLPSLHVTYSPVSNMKFRGAITRSFARPDFGDITTGGTYESNEDEYSVGNPQLNPTYSLNYDLMAEYYFSKVGLLSGGVFYKSITDPIFKSKVAKDYNGDGTIDSVKTSLNGDDASLYGLEMAFNTQFDMLPSFFKYFGINANFTLMDSEMSIPDRSDTVSIPRQADLLYNATLYYDDAAFHARLAYNYKGAYIMEHGDSSNFDEYYGDNTTVDVSMGYNVNNSLSLFAEVLNITDEPLVYYQGDEDRILQYEKYGMRGQVGLKYTY